MIKKVLPLIVVLLFASAVSAQCCYYPVVHFQPVQLVQLQPVQVVQPIAVQQIAVQPVDTYRATLATRMRWAAEDRARRRAVFYSFPAVPAVIASPAVAVPAK